MRAFIQSLAAIVILPILFILGLGVMFYITLMMGLILLSLYLAVRVIRFKTESRAQDGDLEVILLTEGVSYKDVTPPQDVSKTPNL